MVMAGQRRRVGCFSFWVLDVGWKKKEERKNERERRKVSVFICKGKVYYYNFAIYSKQKRRTNGDLRLHLMKPASGLLKLDAEIIAASKKEKRKIALEKRQKGMGDLIWVDFL